MITEQKARVMEAVAESVQIPTGERLRPELNFTYLTPLEHAIMGSSVYEVEGGKTKLISPEEILQREDLFLFRPLGVIEGTKDNSEILRERGGKYIEGYFFIFHSPQMIKGRYNERIWLSTEVQEDGTIRPRFRVQLIGSDGEVVKDEALIEKMLKISRKREYFALSHGEVPGERIVEFKKPTPKAA